LATRRNRADLPSFQAPGIVRRVTAFLTDIDLLGRLVGFDTTSHRSTEPIGEFIGGYVDKPGVRIDRNPSPDGSKANLVITVGPEDATGARRGLGLSGHMDVVPAEEDGWRSDPFVLTEVDGTLVGRGACDMKGFLAVAINRAARLDPQRLRRPLCLILTFDEEIGTLGAKHFAETWGEVERLPKSLIIGEPTSLRVVRMHKGYVALELTLRGKPAHTGYPHLGVNAIEPAARAIVALSELAREWEAERPPQGEFFGDVPYPSLTVATISGGTATNVVPDRCVTRIGIRVLPGMSSTGLVDGVDAAVKAALGVTPYELKVLSSSPPLLLAEGAEIYKALCTVAEQSGTNAVSYATDGGWLQTAGFDCAVYGPGSIEVAHRPNEYVPIDELERAGGVLDALIHRTCLAPE
jgi:acetylornithine deacetylase